MANIFRNEYKVYLYKYNYEKLQKEVKDKFKDENSGNAYKYLFESFITDLYSLGLPSDKIKEDYLTYVQIYKTINNQVTTKQKRSQQSGYTTTTYTSKNASLVSSSEDINAYRSPKTIEDNILQEALAQNYALQQLQKRYEDDIMMGKGSEIHWLNTKRDKESYLQSLKSALEKSKDLLNSLFDPVIDEIATIRKSGNIQSDYVHCIELTDLSGTEALVIPTTDRTKNSCDTFLNAKVTNRLISDDVSTNALTNIGQIKTDLTQLTNTTSLTLRQDILLKYNIHIEPNDVIEIVSTNYNKTIDIDTYDVVDNNPLNRNTQFLGFITQISVSNRYGQTSEMSVTCEGISKLLSMNPVVSDNAVAPQFNNLLDFVAQAKKNSSDMTTVNVYMTQYNNSTVYELFTEIMSKVLAASPIDGDTTNYTVRYISDIEKLKKLQYQYCKHLIVLYHLAASISTVRQCGPTEVIIAKVDCNILQTKLQAYLKQLRTNFTNFWSTYSSPIQILNAIVENSFLEIYEDRCGVLIMRTPRYNTWFGKDIIEMEDVIDWTQTLSDVELKSRSDYQWQIDFIGTMSNFPGNAYENVPALLKYGFRADSPKTSPNAKNEKLCAVFGALDVTRSNSKTRVIRMTVPMIQDYVLGRLYYIPIQNKNGVDDLQSVGCVGYLSSITSNIEPGDVDKHTLEFTYVRNAELLKEDLTIRDNYGQILNFNHLPDLEIMMNLFTSEDIQKPAVTEKSDTTKSSLPAQYHYYWAAYEAAYKKVFDKLSSGKASTFTDKEAKYFDKTMAPTLLTKNSFKSYKENENTLSNNSYIPTQQLINTIWYIDMCLRYNEDMTQDLTTDNSDKTAKTGLAGYKKYVGKLLRNVTFKSSLNQNADMSAILNYLNRDATFSKNKKSLTYILNSANNPYAHIDNFFVNESLAPSMRQPINQIGDVTTVDKLNNFMTLFSNAYNYINGSDFDRTKFIEQLDVIKTSTDFDNVCSEIKVIIDEFKIYINNDYNYINFYSALINNLENNRNSQFISNMLKTYYYYAYSKKENSVYKIDVDTYTAINKLKLNGMEKHVPILDDITNYLYKDETTNTKKSLNKRQQIIQLAPAVVMKPSVTVPPLLTFKDYKYGTYLAGISPVDYKTFFKNQISSLISTELPKSNGQIKLDDLSFKNALNNDIGKITGFVYDPNISDDINLYFYPIIEFNKDIDVSGYITKKEDLDNFVNAVYNGNKLTSVVCVSPVHIPESKIPTIQQIAHKGGLYVGKTSDEKLTLNSKAAIIDPSVIFNWSKSELNNAYQATIYNFISNDVYCKSKLNNKYLDIHTSPNITPWASKIKNREALEKSACVFSSSVNFNGLSRDTFTDPSVSTNILNIFKNLESINSKNKFFTIENLPNTTKFQLEDTVTNFATEKVTDTIRLSYSYDNSDNNTVYAVSNDDALTSVSSYEEGQQETEFTNYTNSRENVNLSLYTDNEKYSTIFYNAKDKYPMNIFRDTNAKTSTSTLTVDETNFEATKNIMSQQ